MHLSKACSQYGASMGRQSDRTLAGKLRLQRVRLDAGGYDSGGAYWGCGQALWRAQDDDGNEQFFRADNRDEAKAELRAKHDGISFYR